MPFDPQRQRRYQECYVINSLEGGGAERVFSQLLHLLPEAERRQCLIILLDRKPEKYPLPDNIHTIRIASKNPLLKFFRFLATVFRYRPARMISFLTRANLFNIIAGLIFRHESFISERSNTTGRLSGRYFWLKKRITQLIYARARHIIAVSAGVRACLIRDYGLSGARITVLTNPVDSQRIRQHLPVLNSSQTTGSINRTDESQPIVAMGRLVRTKGFDTLIRAYAMSGLDCGLVILGQGPERASLQQLASDLGIAADVEFTGFVPEPYLQIQQAAFFVLPSRLEGFPNALLEAMSLGKAVIAADCTDGPREILAFHGSIEPDNFTGCPHGILFNVDDDTALASALSYLSSDHAARRNYEYKSLERVSDYTPDRFYADFRHILSHSR